MAVASHTRRVVFVETTVARMVAVVHFPVVISVLLAVLVPKLLLPTSHLLQRVWRDFLLSSLRRFELLIEVGQRIGSICASWGLLLLVRVNALVVDLDGRRSGRLLRRTIVGVFLVGIHRSSSFRKLIAAKESKQR